MIRIIIDVIISITFLVFIAVGHYDATIEYNEDNEIYR